MTSRFELLEIIGRGGMGVVWKARDIETGEMVALKLLREAYAEDPDYIARFEREVETAQRIDSPHVVRVLGHGLREGIPFIAMEYVDGQSLRERLRAEGPMSWPEAAELTRQLLLGLDAAHRAQVLHRDIKPGNILISKDGTAKLADFGIAKALDMTALTGTSTMLGTPAYMAPDREESIQTDLYSLGCVVYEMLAGAPPFEGPSLQSVVTAHYRDRPNLERLSPESRGFVGALLEKDAQKRPADAALALKRLPLIEKADAVPLRDRRRRYVMAGTLIAATLGLGAFGAVFAGMGDQADQATPSSLTVAAPTPTRPSTATPSPSATFTVGPVGKLSPTPTVSPTSTAFPSAASPPPPTVPSTPLPTATLVPPAPPTPTMAPVLEPTQVPPTAGPTSVFSGQPVVIQVCSASELSAVEVSVTCQVNSYSYQRWLLWVGIPTAFPSPGLVLDPGSTGPGSISYLAGTVPRTNCVASRVDVELMLLDDAGAVLGASQIYAFPIGCTKP